MAEIVKRYKVQELHVSFTRGRWEYEQWGIPALPAPPGAEVWAWFSPALNSSHVDREWHGLTNALSGLLCGSLNLLTSDIVSSPKWAFPPEGHVQGETNLTENHLRRGSLPREALCTENLTPWLKLLPCGDRAGLASILRPR